MDRIADLRMMVGKYLVAPTREALADARDVLVERHSSIAEAALRYAVIWAFFLTFAGQGVRNTFGWFEFGAIAAVSLVVLGVLFITAGRMLSIRRLPALPVAFVLWCTVSVLWSQYRLETVAASMLSIATTLTGVALAVAYPLRRFIELLTAALKWILAGSLALELFVELALGGERLAPLYMRDWDHVADMHYWVNGLLFEGGPIQGLVGNRNPLAFIALLALICVFITWYDTRTKGWSALLWSGISLGVLALTRSATVTLALIACGMIFAAVWVMRRLSRQARSVALRILVVVAAVVIILAVVFEDDISALTSRSPDMSGRGVIWSRLTELWKVHPILGWGWIMYWVPWIPMFRNLVVRADGTPTMSAHNSYLEALFQTGIVGAVIVTGAVIVVTIRAFRVAYRSLANDVFNVMPAVLMTALVIQSFTESRLLSEGNWVLFVAIATWLNLRTHLPGTTRECVGESVHEGEQDRIDGANEGMIKG